MNDDDWSDSKNDDKNLKWNYEGKIDNKYAIKAFIEYGDDPNESGAGGWSVLISGYYFYESTKIKIPIRGIANSGGMVNFTATTKGGDEYFEGEWPDDYFSNISGTWINAKGDKRLPFYLNGGE